MNATRRSRFVDRCRRPTIRPRVPTVTMARCVSCRCSLRWVATRHRLRLRLPEPVAGAAPVAVAPTDRPFGSVPHESTRQSHVGEVSCGHGVVDRRSGGGRSGRRHRRRGRARAGSAPDREARSGARAQGAPPLTLFVDECRWWFRERRWCHLVSDDGLDELHDFAARLGVSTRAFHGDHYDLPEDFRERAVELGACAVTSRDVVGVLRSTGLRLTPDERRNGHRQPI